MKRLSCGRRFIYLCDMNKDQVIDACYTIINQKIEQVNLAIADANQSLHDDTKSSAGDKYETSREMIQQDLNRYEQQLQVLHADIEILRRIQTQKTGNSKAGLGSLIQTSNAHYFLATSIGLVTLGETKVFSISTASPIGKLLLGLSVGDTFNFNGVSQDIIALY